MRAAILEGERKFAIKDVPEPVLDAEEVLIKVECCGICGSDLPTYVVGVPARQGHEFSGDIVKLGAGVTGWEIGDRVTAESISSCHECYRCMRGQPELCADFDMTWFHRAGGFATFTKSRQDPPRGKLRRGSPGRANGHRAACRPAVGDAGRRCGRSAGPGPHRAARGTAGEGIRGRSGVRHRDQSVQD